MSFKIRGPSLKIGGFRFRKTKNGWTMLSKTLLGNRKTTNLKTGKTTKTYKSIIPGKSTNISRNVNGNVEISKRYNPSFSIFGIRFKKTKSGVSISSKNVFGGADTYNTGTGVQTKSYNTIIPGVKYQTKKQIGGDKSKTNAPE